VDRRGPTPEQHLCWRGSGEAAVVVVGVSAAAVVMVAVVTGAVLAVVMGRHGVLRDPLP
jgi:hypothetical protein